MAEARGRFVGATGAVRAVSTQGVIGPDGRLRPRGTRRAEVAACPQSGRASPARPARVPRPRLCAVPIVRRSAERSWDGRLRRRAGIGRRAERHDRRSPPHPAIVTCASKPGERTQCAADTSKGVVLLRSTGEAPCLLGKTWGYDQTSVWVSDGCSAEFGTGPRGAADDEAEAALSHIPNVGFLLFDGEKGQIYFRLFSYARYLNQRNLDDSYVDAFGNTHTVSSAPGHPAAEVLRAVLGLVPHAEDALLPVRLVVERVAGRSGAGRRRGQSDLDLQPVRDRGRRHHVAARRAKHRRSVPVLARRRRPPDCRRVLPRVVHLRRLAQRRAPHEGQVPGDVRQQPEHARRERGAARQQARHAVLLGRSGCRRPASSACGTRSATTTITRRSRPGSACTTPTASRKSKASREPKASRTARSA